MDGEMRSIESEHRRLDVLDSGCNRPIGRSVSDGVITGGDAGVRWRGAGEFAERRGRLFWQIVEGVVLRVQTAGFGDSEGADFGSGDDLWQGG